MSALHSDTMGKIAAALIDAQAEFKPAVKDATNPHFQSKFVSLNGVLDAVADSLRKHRIAVVQQTDVTDAGGCVLVTRLIHESGEWLGGRYPVRPVKQDPQSEGSALTYARRYALMSLVGIAPEDDDGHAASQPAPRQRRTRQTEPTMVDTAKDELRAEIFTAGNSVGLATWTDIASDFASWSMGEVMGEALLERLIAYRDHLVGQVAA